MHSKFLTAVIDLFKFLIRNLATEGIADIYWLNTDRSLLSWVPLASKDLSNSHIQGW